jgi:membrane-associated protease RseP (regulator of RpoE activity)
MSIAPDTDSSMEPTETDLRTNEPTDAADTKRTSAHRPLLLLLATALVLAFAQPALGLTVLALLIVVTIHEGGHYLAARSMRLHTPEFAVGIGPQIVSRQGRHTEWSLRAIPLGGFVRIAGMANSSLDSAETDQIPEGKRGWSELNRAQRAYLAFAGPFANFALSVVVIIGVLFALGTPQSDAAFVAPSPNTPAAAAGVQKGDVVRSIDGRDVGTFLDLRDITADLEPGTPVPVVVERGTETVELTVTPTVTENRVVLGVTYDPKLRRPSPTELASNTALGTWGLMRATGSGIAQLGSAVSALPRQIMGGEEVDPAQRLLSPIGAAQVAEQSAERDGWFGPFSLLAAASMFIGAFNLLPFPPLDGGHIAIAGYEAAASKLRRRRVEVDMNRLAPFVRTAVALILVVGVSSILMDIFNPIQLP